MNKQNPKKFSSIDIEWMTSKKLNAEISAGNIYITEIPKTVFYKITPKKLGKKINSGEWPIAEISAAQINCFSAKKLQEIMPAMLGQLQVSQLSELSDFTAQELAPWFIINIFEKFLMFPFANLKSHTIISFFACEELAKLPPEKLNKLPREYWQKLPPEFFVNFPFAKLTSNDIQYLPAETVKKLPLTLQQNKLLDQQFEESTSETLFAVGFDNITPETFYQFTVEHLLFLTVNVQKLSPAHLRHLTDDLIKNFHVEIISKFSAEQLLANEELLLNTFIEKQWKMLTNNQIAVLELLAEDNRSYQFVNNSFYQARITSQKVSGKEELPKDNEHVSNLVLNLPDCDQTRNHFPDEIVAKINSFPDNCNEFYGESDNEQGFYPSCL